MLHPVTKEKIPHTSHPSVWNTNCETKNAETCMAIINLTNIVDCPKCTFQWDIKFNYSDYGDIIKNYSNISSAIARSAITELIRKYKLNFTVNPNSGNFSCDIKESLFYGFKCIVTTYDDVLDLETLKYKIREWINGKEK